MKSNEKQKYHTVQAIPKSNFKIVDKDKLYTHHTNTRPLNFLAWYGHKYKVAPLFKEQLLLKDTCF